MPESVQDLPRLAGLLADVTAGNTPSRGRVFAAEGLELRVRLLRRPPPVRAVRVGLAGLPSPLDSLQLQCDVADTRAIAAETELVLRAKKLFVAAHRPVLEALLASWFPTVPIREDAFDLLLRGIGYDLAGAVAKGPDGTRPAAVEPSAAATGRFPVVPRPPRTPPPPAREKSPTLPPDPPPAPAPVPFRAVPVCAVSTRAPSGVIPDEKLPATKQEQAIVRVPSSVLSRRDTLEDEDPRPPAQRHADHRSEADTVVTPPPTSPAAQPSTRPTGPATRPAQRLFEGTEPLRIPIRIVHPTGTGHRGFVYRVSPDGKRAFLCVACPPPAFGSRIEIVIDVPGQTEDGPIDLVTSLAWSDPMPEDPLVAAFGVRISPTSGDVHLERWMAAIERARGLWGGRKDDAPVVRGEALPTPPHDLVLRVHALAAG